MSYKGFSISVGSKFGSIMLNLPIYLRNNTYYFHFRVRGRQVKRSLQTFDKATAIIRASKLMEAVQMEIDLSKIKRYEIDLERGIVKADGVADHNRMLKTLEALRMSGVTAQKTIPKDATAGGSLGSLAKRPEAYKGLTLTELLDKYVLLKKLKSATVLAHRNTVLEFESFFQKKCHITEIMVSDISRYQEFLATERKNQPRTIDSKVGYIKSMLNFALKQGYINGKNPANGMVLLTKKQRLNEGYGIFELQEIKQIFTSSQFTQQKQKDPDYFYTVLLGLVTGCRIGEITSLKTDQFQVSNGIRYIVIREAKTMAGKREIPLPSKIFDKDFTEFLASKKTEVFKYAPKLGKGSGNAVGKKFARCLDELKITREKLVFHSLRKFANDYFMKNGAEIEPRCQFLGHELENVNVSTYSKRFNIGELATIFNPIQEKILAEINM